MKPRRFWEANQVFRLSGGTEDNDLWVEQFVAEDEVIGQHPALRCVYEFTEQERQQIARGANVSLTILAVQQPPVMMAVTDEHLGKPPFRVRRADGWPLCPACGADELYSLADPATIGTIGGCYACPWEPA